MPTETADQPDMPDAVIRSPGAPELGAFLNVVRTSVRLMDEVADVVKSEGLTEPQFNALRILRGAGPEGLPCSAIGRRMIRRVPDITRLVDRLEREGLAERRRDDAPDRRVVRVTISDRGRGLLRRLDGPVRALHRRQFEHLTRTELRDMTRLLQKVRTR